MGAHDSKQAPLLDMYPIKITTLQSNSLFGMFRPKTTLTWADIIEKGSKVTFRDCVNAKIQISKLYQMQKDLDEWIRYKKVVLEDCKDLALWCPNPFYHFQANIGDLILKRHIISAEMLVQGGVTFDILWERYGLNPDLMALIRYTPEQWVALGIQDKHLQCFSDDQMYAVFGRLQRKDILQAIA